MVGGARKPCPILYMAAQTPQRINKTAFYSKQYGTYVCKNTCNIFFLLKTITASETLQSHNKRASSIVDGSSCAEFRVDIRLFRTMYNRNRCRLDTHIILLYIHVHSVNI